MTFAEREDVIHRLLGTLDPKENDDLACRFGLNGFQPQTLEEIGEKVRCHKGTHQANRSEGAEGLAAPLPFRNPHATLARLTRPLPCRCHPVLTFDTFHQDAECGGGLLLHGGLFQRTEMAAQVRQQAKKKPLDLAVRLGQRGQGVLPWFMGGDPPSVFRLGVAVGLRQLAG